MISSTETRCIAPGSCIARSECAAIERDSTVFRWLTRSIRHESAVQSPSRVYSSQSECQDIRVAAAGVSTRPTPLLAKSFTHDRKTCFMTFPLAVFGSSSGTPSSPANHTQAGAFYSHSFSDHPKQQRTRIDVPEGSYPARRIHGRPRARSAVRYLPARSTRPPPRPELDLAPPPMQPR